MTLRPLEGGKAMHTSYIPGKIMPGVSTLLRNSLVQCPHLRFRYTLGPQPSQYPLQLPLDLNNISILGGVPWAAVSGTLLSWAERAQGPPVQRIGLLGIPKHIKLLKERLHAYINQSSRLINWLSGDMSRIKLASE